MSGDVKKKSGRSGRPAGSGGYAMLSKMLGDSFNRATELVGGKEAVANLIADEMRERPLEVLKVMNGFLPRTHAIGVEVSASDSLTDALAAVQQTINERRLNNPETIEAEYEEVSRNDEADSEKGEEVSRNEKSKG